VAADRELSSAPGTLELFARAGAALVPGASRLPFVAGGGGEVPNLSLALNDVVVDRDRLAAYSRVCGFSLRDELPATYPHVLAFPLQLALMTDGSFPFGAVGLVHIANKITQHRAVGAAERLTLRVRAGKLEPHPRGRQFPLLTEVRVGDELVWEEESVNLKRGREGGGSGGGPGGADDAVRARARTEKAGEEELPAVAEWRLPGDLGRRYAAVSGDRNPIHMHSLSARLFGFPSAIAHGMWTEARCLAALEGRLPDAFSVEVSFRKPILLPATVVFGEAADDSGVRFGVRDAGRGTPHLDGSLRPR
jgi:MaoC like domain